MNHFARSAAAPFLLILAIFAFAAFARGDNHVTGVPQLNSRPGAPYTIYLDFAGFDFGGTWLSSTGAAWGNKPAFDGAVTGSFSPAQQTNIEQLWAAVADGYSLFNVNVTTVDPAVAAGQTGTDAQRQAFYDQTVNTMHTVMTTAVGGISAVGVISSTYSTTANNGAGYGRHTNWDFYSSRYPAYPEDAIHENGHAFGLSHQSDYVGSTLVNGYDFGDANYAPIMGAAYNSRRGAWAAGSSNNGGTNFQNDIATILNTTQNPGIQLVDDGIGHSQGTATPLPLSGGNANFNLAKGVIMPNSSIAPTPIGASNYTHDYFSFQSNGIAPISFTVNDGTDYVTPGTADPTVMLRSTLTILNGAGQTVGTGTEAASTFLETFSGVLPAGKYYAEISSYGGNTQTLYSGTGSANFNTRQYYDAGSYFVTGAGLAYVVWANPVSGSWTTPGNWNNNSVPSAQGAEVLINPATTSPLTITLDGPQTVGTLVLGNSLSSAAGYTLDPGANGTLTFDSLGSAASIIVASGSHSITNGSHGLSAAVILSGGVVVTTSANAALSISGNISGNGSLGKSGPGLLTLSGFNTFSGGVTVSGGTINMPGGYLSPNGEFIGYTQPGTFTQSGGINLAGNLWLGYYAGNPGTYNLNAGQLTLAGLLQGGGPAAFNFSGGKFQAGAGFSSSVPITLATPGNNAIFDSNGWTMNLNGALSGPGGLQKIGSGKVVVTAANNYGGDTTVSAGTLQVSNGLLPAASEYVGGSGGAYLALSAGSNIVSSALIEAENPGETGTYALSGPSYLSAASESVGYAGTGSFIQSGGTNSLSSGTLTVGVFGTGSYNLQSNGQLTAGTEILGWTSTGSFAQTGGTNAAGALYLGDAAFSFIGSGSYNLGGSGLLAANTEFVGYFGSGSFSQTGGVNAMTSGALWLGYNAGSTGTYNLSNSGRLSASLEIVGLFGSGNFMQSGGTHAVSTLYLGDDPGSSGTYSLSGSGQLSVGGLIIGNSASGNFTQTGGTNTVSSGVVLADYAGSSGTYSLNGGLLSLAGLSQGGGNAKFNFGAGTLQVYGGPGFSTSVPIFLSTLGSNGTFDTNGSTLTLNGAVTGSGGLQKIGAGQLTLTAGNSYGGPTTLGAGVLIAANGATLSATGTGAVTLNGGTLAGGAAGGTITGLVQAGSGPHTIGPGAALASGYGTLNLFGGLTTNNYTRLQFNFNQNTVLGTGTNGDSIYGGDLINLNGSALTINSVGGIGGVIALVANPVEPGDYRLFKSAGGSPNLSALVTPPAGAEVYSLSTSVDSGYIDLVAATNVSASGGTWTHNGNGSWTVGGNWSSNPAIPGGGTVAFPDVNASSPVTVSLNGNQSAGALVFSVSNANGYTLAQGTGGALTLGTSAGGSIAVIRGAHSISAPVVLAGDLAVSTSSGTSLTLAGGLYESKAGSALTLSGAGQVILSGPGSFTGNTTVGGGTVQITAGGQLPAANEYVGNTTGAVSVIQSGGSNVATKEIYFGWFSSASGTLSGGLMSAPIEYIGFGDNGTFVQTGGTNAASSNLTIADGSFTQGSYTLGGSGLITATNETFGWNGHANFTQSGGINVVDYNLTIGTNTMGYGNYFLNSGNLSAFSETIGASGNGEVLQSGGNNTVAWEMDLGYNSSSTAALYSLSGGSLSVPLEYIGYNGNASFYQNGGTNAVASDHTSPVLDLGYQASGSGSYALTGSGLLTVGFNEYVGDNGTGSFTQTGGTHSVSGFMILGNNAGGSGSYLLSSGLLNSGAGGNTTEYIGNSGSGSFTQTGGNHIVSGILLLGSAAGSSGSYDLQSGNLSANTEWVGLSGSGSFSQSGGMNATTILFLGMNGGSGTYNLSGIGQLSALYEYIAAAATTDMNSGAGNFTQTGGTNSAGSLNLAYGAGYTGTYNLNGGLLSLTALNQGGGAAAFNFSGGTFQAVTPSFQTSVPITLATPGSNGVFDTNGNALTLNGAISGPGGLIVVGAGTLTLAVSNNYTGTTLVSDGTLTLADSNSLSGSTFDTTGSGLLSLKGGIGGFSFGGLQGSGSLLLTDASGADVALTVGGNNASTTFAGSLSDSNSAGSLTKVGTGTLVLSGTNAYLGGTTVADGTLTVINSEGLVDGASLTVGDGTFFPAAVVPAPVVSSSVAPVPEPGTAALLIVAAALLAAYRSRR